MDNSGLYFLQPDGAVTVVPAYWPSRDQAKADYRAWAGKIGHQKPGPRPPIGSNIQDRGRQFERIFNCLLLLWKAYPGGLTAEAVQRQVEQRLGYRMVSATWKRCLGFLVKFGFAIKAGPVFTAVPEFARWFSEDSSLSIAKELADDKC